MIDIDRFTAFLKIVYDDIESDGIVTDTYILAIGDNDLFYLDNAGLRASFEKEIKMVKSELEAGNSITYTVLTPEEAKLELFLRKL